MIEDMKQSRSIEQRAEQNDSRTIEQAAKDKIYRTK
jgi:hypothetical protein